MIFPDLIKIDKKSKIDIYIYIYIYIYNIKSLLPNLLYKLYYKNKNMLQLLYALFVFDLDVQIICRVK